MASTSSHLKKSGNSEKSRRSDQDSVTLHQSGDASSKGRFVRLIVYEKGKQDAVRRIWIYEQSTYGGIGRALEEEDPTVSYAILQPIWGPRPHWTEADPNTPLAETCQVLYIVVKKEDSRYITGVVRTPVSDYPIPIYDEAYESSRTVSQAVISSHPSLTGQIKSIFGYPDNGDLKDSEYSHESLKKYQHSSSPAIIITLDEPSSKLVTDMSDHLILPTLQRPFRYCKHLIEQAHDLDSFALQTIHVARALLHIIISLARTTEPMLAKDGPDMEEALELDEGLADSLRITPILTQEIEGLLNALNQIVENIRSGEGSYTGIEDSIGALFVAVCGDYPGAVAIRQSYRTFQELSREDREEEVRNLTRSESNTQQVAKNSTVQPVITTSATQQATAPGIIQHPTIPSISAEDGAPKQKVLEQMFQETLKVTDVSLQRGRNQPLPSIPTADYSGDKGKHKGGSPEEASRGLHAVFMQNPKVVTPGAPANTGHKPFIEATYSASMSSPLPPLSPNHIILEDSSQEAQISRRARIVANRRLLTSQIKDSTDVLHIARREPLVPTSPYFSTLPRPSRRLSLVAIAQPNPAEVKWQYIDDQKITQGPFTPQDLTIRDKSGWLSADLLMNRPKHDTVFLPLSTWKEKLNAAPHKGEDKGVFLTWFEPVHENKSELGRAIQPPSGLAGHETQLSPTDENTPAQRLAEPSNLKVPGSPSLFDIYGYYSPPPEFADNDFGYSSVTSHSLPMKATNVAPVSAHTNRYTGYQAHSYAGYYTSVTGQSPALFKQGMNKDEELGTWPDQYMPLSSSSTTYPGVTQLSAGYDGFYEPERRHLQPYTFGPEALQQQYSPLPSLSTTHLDIMQPFPLDTEDHRLKRESLGAVMHSTWKQNNELEPDESLLLQFMPWDPIDMKFRCLLWKHGQPCECSCRKKDHAKGHIRSHIQHVPFACNSQCRDSDAGCGRRYPSIEGLQKHQAKQTECVHCSRPMLSTNLKRHMQTFHPEIILGQDDVSTLGESSGESRDQ